MATTRGGFAGRVAYDAARRIEAETVAAEVDRVFGITERFWSIFWLELSAPKAPGLPSTPELISALVMVVRQGMAVISHFQPFILTYSIRQRYYLSHGLSHGFSYGCRTIYIYIYQLDRYI